MKQLSKLTLGILLFAAVSFAQNTKTQPLTVYTPPPPPADAFQQEVMANLTNPVGDSFVQLFNAGANGGTDATGTIVAQVYVFDAVDEQVVACCSCPLTPDQAATISGKNSLISNPLTPHIPAAITVKLVATKGGNAATDQRQKGAPGFSSGLRADRTTTHFYNGLAPFVTEVPFHYVTIADSEYSKLVTTCSSIQTTGSGFGICGGCAAGALDPTQP